MNRKEEIRIPVVSSGVYTALFTVSRYLFPFLAVLMLIFFLLWLLSDHRARRDRIRNLPGYGTVGELVVLSGGPSLESNTWFPVPREGVLGALRSCDLVIPCAGVRGHHLDFAWRDGLGLLIYPYSGCEVLINGTPVTCHTAVVSVPLTHGSILQVGSAVLRLHLFAALDHSPRPEEISVIPVPQDQALTDPLQPAPAAQSQSFAWHSADLSAPVDPALPDLPFSGTPPMAVPPMPDLPLSTPSPTAVPAQPDLPFSTPSPTAVSTVPSQETPPSQSRSRLHRSDHWEEDWSE
uniref:FHA domain-containing protein n=1 Tax=uncultured bacterium Contigcl_30 TaxID=1393670 RepID=W0FQ85_9BACT|nr:hypothetical protein [uncultured bacterium Contigcl_30]